MPIVQNLATEYGKLRLEVSAERLAYIESKDENCNGTTIIIRKKPYYVYAIFKFHHDLKTHGLQRIDVFEERFMGKRATDSVCVVAERICNELIKEVRPNDFHEAACVRAKNDLARAEENLERLKEAVMEQERSIEELKKESAHLLK